MASTYNYKTVLLHFEVEHKIIMSIPSHVQYLCTDVCIFHGFSQVSVGTNLFQVLDDRLSFVSSEDGGVPTAIIVPALLVPVIVILLIAVVCVVSIVLLVRKKYRTKELHLTAELELQTSVKKNTSECFIISYVAT